MLAEAGVTVTDTTGTFVTVIAAVPLCPSLVAVIVADPGAMAVTFPFTSAIATEVLLLDHVTVRPESGLPFASFGVADGHVVERSEEHTSELQSHHDIVCRLLLEKKKSILKVLYAMLMKASGVVTLGWNRQFVLKVATYMSILIVEDEPDLLAVLTKALLEDCYAL